MNTIEQFITDRLAGWGEICVIPQERGGFDIVLRVDGSYATRREAEDMGEWFRQRLLELLHDPAEAA